MTLNSILEMSIQSYEIVARSRNHARTNGVNRDLALFEIENPITG
jgi:hypothetical protein